MPNLRLERELVARLGAAVGDRLVAVVLHGPEVHEDDYRGIGTAHLLIVLADLEPATLRALGDPVRWWRRRGQTWPRLFTPALIRDAADVWPIELLDIARHRLVLHGDDPLAAVRIDLRHLRVQCERELRERLMRLREGYVEAHGRRGAVRELIALSLPSFAQVFRGCVHLLGGEVPRHDADVIAAVCARLDLDPGAFDGAARIARGEVTPDPEAAFAAMARAIEAVTARIDSHRHEGSSR